MIIDHALTNAVSKGHGINGMDKAKAFYRPKGHKFKNACACTRDHRCELHVERELRTAERTRWFRGARIPRYARVGRNGSTP